MEREGPFSQSSRDAVRKAQEKFAPLEEAERREAEKAKLSEEDNERRAWDMLSNHRTGSERIASKTETVQNSPIKVGKATTIYSPYFGKMPVQEASTTHTVKLPWESMKGASAQIKAAEKVGNTMQIGVAAALKQAIESTFTPKKGIPVDGARYNGKQYVVDVNKNIVGKVISQYASPESIAVLNNVEQVVHHGEYVGSGAFNRAGKRNKNTIRFDYFETPIVIDGGKYVVTFDVEAFPNVNNYKTHRVQNMELSEISNADTGQKPATKDTQTTPENNIFFSRRKVNKELETDPERREAEAITQILIDDLAKGYRMEARAKKEKAEAEAITQILINDWAMKLREEAKSNGANAEAGTSGGLAYDDDVQKNTDIARDIEKDPLQSILHDERDGTLQTDKVSAKMEETAEQEDDSDDGRKPKRDESKKAFLRRSCHGVFEIFEVGKTAYGFRPVATRPPNRNAQAVQRELAALGIPSFIHEGDIESNRDGKTLLVGSPEAVTIGKTIVGINNTVSIPAKNTAGHEAFHFWSATLTAQAYIDTLKDNLLYTSQDFLYYQGIIEQDHFGGNVDLRDPVKARKFMEELYAYLSGDIHEGAYDQELRRIFRDYDAVKTAWEKLVFIRQQIKKD